MSDAPALHVLSRRVDALTLAYRVALDPAVVRRLRERAEVAKAHGRASFSMAVEVPESLAAHRRRLGRDVRAAWCDAAPFEMVGGVVVEPEAFKRRDARELAWGELRYSRALKVWTITNEPFWRMRIDLCGPSKAVEAEEKVTPREVRDKLDPEGRGLPREPGWTVEIVWYAEELARIGLAAALEEARALARALGDVREARVRRIDLCADVQGWRIDESDVTRLVKRSRASWAKEYGDPERERAADEFEPLHPSRAEERAEPRGVSTFGVELPAPEAERRPLTGLVVGRGGAMSSRIYDKRAELGRDNSDATARRRDAEEARWREAGWDGEAPVSRVEFQIRGAAVAELGIRDPDCAQVPIVVVDPKTGRAKAAGFRPAVVEEDGREREATIVDRLDAIWKTALDWVRLVEPKTTASGRRIPPSRLDDDPRWALLRRVRFTDLDAAPIRRFRPRAAASAAQALGVTLSQAAKDGTIPREWSDDPRDYDAATAARILESRVRRLKLAEAARVCAWLVERQGDAVGALVHLAVRADAARARFHGRPGLAPASKERPPPESGPRLVAGSLKTSAA